MALETATYVGELVSTNPPGTDNKSQGDDHLRLIKATIQATFPGMAGAFGRVQAKATDYTLVANDNTSIIRHHTAAATATLTAAATLGNQWMAVVLADGVAVTIDPNGAETINGAATLALSSGQGAFIWCNGSAFFAAVFSTIAYRPSEYLISHTAVSAAASQDLTFPTTPTFKHFKLVIEDWVPVSDSGMLLRVAVASVVQSGASDYGYGGASADTGSIANVSDNADTALSLASVDSGESGGGASAVVHILNPFGTVQKKHVHWSSIASRTGSPGDPEHRTMGGWYAADSALTGIRLLCSTGNISKANLSLYGIL